MKGNEDLSVEEMMARLRARFQEAGLGPVNNEDTPMKPESRQKFNVEASLRSPPMKKSPMSSHARLKNNGNTSALTAQIDKHGTMSQSEIMLEDAPRHHRPELDYNGIREKYQFLRNKRMPSFEVKTKVEAEVIPKPIGIPNHVLSSPHISNSPLISHQASFNGYGNITEDAWLDDEMEGELLVAHDDHDDPSMNQNYHMPQDKRVLSGNLARSAMKQGPTQLEQAQMYENQVHQMMVQFEMEKQAWAAQMHHMQLAWQADKQQYEPLEQKYQELQQSSTRDRVEAQLKIEDLAKEKTKLTEEVTTLREEKAKFDEIIQQKETDFQNMKIMVDNQMNTMRAHFLGLQREHQRLLGLKDTLNSRINTSEQRCEQLQAQLEIKRREVEEAQQKTSLFANKAERAEAELITLQSNQSQQTHDANLEYQQLQAMYGELANKHQNLYSLNEAMKQQFVNVRVENGRMNSQIAMMQKKLQESELEKKELIEMTEALLEGSQMLSE